MTFEKSTEKALNLTFFYQFFYYIRCIFENKEHFLLVTYFKNNYYLNSMRKTIVETLFFLNHKNKLFEKKKILTEKKSVPKVTDKSSVSLSVRR